jgi:hypothetical protein
MKTKWFSLNNHMVKAIVPSSTISLNEGIKRMEKIFSKK